MGPAQVTTAVQVQSLQMGTCHAGARKEPLKPLPEASGLVPGTHGVDALPVVTAMLVLHGVPVTYYNYPHRVLYLLHRLPAWLSLRGSGLCCRDGPTSHHSAFLNARPVPHASWDSFL